MSKYVKVGAVIAVVLTGIAVAVKCIPVDLTGIEEELEGLMESEE